MITGDFGRAVEDLACADYIAALRTRPGTEAAPYLALAARSSAVARMAGLVAARHRGVHAGDRRRLPRGGPLRLRDAGGSEDGLLTLRRVGDPA